MQTLEALVLALLRGSMATRGWQHDCCPGCNHASLPALNFLCLGKSSACSNPFMDLKMETVKEREVIGLTEEGVCLACTRPSSNFGIFVWSSDIYQDEFLSA